MLLPMLMQSAPKLLHQWISRLMIPLVPIQTKELLHNAQEALPNKFKTPQQFLGEQYAGCGATIGVMPRCDFACKGCYLGKEANRIPAESVVGIKKQLDVIQTWLGVGGNVQITDGEATLRPEHELIEIIQYAREIGLVPMLMSHGDALRKSPTLLKRLMQIANLTELSIHIDTTQRGRTGKDYKYAQTEQQLMPLRDEFSQLIRRLRKETGKTLEVATTMTITDDNLADIPNVVRWLCQNADAFKMISFQPVAQVGRTENELGASLTVDQLWSKIAEGLYGNEQHATELAEHQRFFGHPDCTRFVQGFVICEEQMAPVFHPLFQSHDENAIEVFKQWSERLGGISFRSYTRWEKVQCILKILIQHPKFIVCSAFPFVLRRLREINQYSSTRLINAYFLGKVKINYLSFVSHHFMSRSEIETSLGQERINACVFKVPINNKLVSMCEVNALGYREQYYELIRKARLTKDRVKE